MYIYVRTLEAAAPTVFVVWLRACLCPFFVLILLFAFSDRAAELSSWRWSRPSAARAARLLACPFLFCLSDELRA
jgi:hypothetical protein